MLTREQYQRLQSLGLSARQMQQVVDAGGGVQAQKTLSGFGQNVLTSGGRYLGGIASGVINIANPNLEKNTIANITDLAIDAGALAGAHLGNKLRGAVGKQTYTNEQINQLLDNLPRGQGNFLEGPNRARALGRHYADRYGGLDNIVETAYRDPVGVLGDVATVASVGGGALKGIGTAASSPTLVNAGTRLGNFGRAIEPINLSSRGIDAAIRPVRNLVSNIGSSGVADDLARELAVRQTRASPSQLANFEGKTGQDFGDFLREQDLWGSGRQIHEQLSDKIAPLQEQYNSLVRSGRQVNPSDFIYKVIDRIDEIRKTDQSPAALATADAMERWANNFIDLNHRNPTIAIDTIANTKSSGFNKVSNNAMLDPTSLNVNKEIGKIGLDYLNQVAPGSGAVGRQLRDLMAARDVVELQKQLGRGNQILSTARPIVSSAFGGGLVGGAPGAAVAGIGSALVNQPQIQGKIGRMLSGATRGQALPQLRVPQGIQNLGSYRSIIPQLGEFARINRVLNPNTSAQRQDLPTPTYSPGIQMNQGANIRNMPTISTTTPGRASLQSVKSTFKPARIDFSLPKLAFEAPRRQRINVPKY